MNDALSNVAQAEKHLWQYLRRQLEKTGNDDAAIHLEHFLLARAGVPLVRGDLTMVPFEMLHRVSEYTAKLNAADGEIMAWYFDILAEQPGQELPVAEVLEAAQSEAKPPKGAVLKNAGYEQVGGKPVFVARWEREEDGIPVEKDFIQVQINGKTGKSFAMNKRWHTLNFSPTVR